MSKNNGPLFTEGDEIVIGRLAIELEDLSRQINYEGYSCELEPSEKKKLVQSTLKFSEEARKHPMEVRLAMMGSVLLLIAEHYGVNVKHIYQATRANSIERGLTLGDEGLGDDRNATAWDWDD